MIGKYSYHNISWSFGLIIFLLLFQGILSVFYLHKIADNTDKLYKHPYTVSNAARTINMNLISMHRYMKDVALAESEELIALASSLVDMHEKDVFKSFHVIFRSYLGDVEDIETAHRAFIDWKAIRDKVIHLKKQGKDKEASDITRHEGAKHVELLNAETQRLIDFADNKAKFFLNQALKSEANAKVILISLIISSALLALFTSYFAIRKLRSTLRELRSQNKETEKVTQWVDSLLNAAPDATVIINEDGNIVRVNTATVQLFGYTVEEIVNQPVDILLPASLKKRHKNLVAQSFKQPTNVAMSNRTNLTAESKHGDVIAVEISLNFIRNRGELFAIASLRDVTDRRKVEEKIKYQANYDALTGLANRFQAMTKLSEQIKLAQHHQTNVKVLFLDLDDFKKVNDTLGHEAGDEVLIALAKRLKENIPEKGSIARLGGDEFLISLYNIESQTEIELIIDTLLKQIKGPINVGEHGIVLTSTVGVSSYPEDGKTISELLRHADTAMYFAKENGRNQKAFYSNSMAKKVSRRFEIEQHIHSALDNNEFSLVYQPKIESASGSPIGLEALIRWNNPLLGSVSPDEFIPIAESSGNIIAIGLFVLEKSLSMLKKLHILGFTELHLAVNLSPVQFESIELIPQITTLLAKENLPYHCLELEITEGVLIKGSQQIVDSFNKLNELGISIAMDDFGTGYSSLSYLHKYKFNVLKIDKSFVQDISNSDSERELIFQTIQLAHALNLKVVAEGVETQTQADILLGSSCDYIQGYYYSYPLNDQDLIAYITEQSILQNVIHIN
ncbi:EAL domain-containing protein [Vibrio sp. ZSDE26]|uniref:EAL domain-containing protein n=1 Tax=Vibrio amylolyticus TaxID=2847292 RepID=A0A9X1XFF7_9VIBR|nr:EAL domain-containing protein [Vibrio amylolyticus]MCK6262017.1 EAL domain-containing protein [Vibrio amylolyticus]